MIERHSTGMQDSRAEPVSLPGENCHMPILYPTDRLFVTVVSTTSTISALCLENRWLLLADVMSYIILNT